MTAAGVERTPAGLELFLAQMPTDRVVQVRGAGAGDVTNTLARTAELPAALNCWLRPAAAPDAFVAAVLDDLESAAIGLFPAWLPGAEQIRVPGGAGVVAVRALAAAHASRSGQFGPFLSDLATRALGGGAARRRLPPEYRAHGLARVISDALQRDRLILVVDVPAGLSAAGELVAAAGCQWLADAGRIGVWLTGAPLRSIDWLAQATVTRPPAAVVRDSSAQAMVIGDPHPRSKAEAALEAALATRKWAAGRRWNETYQSQALRNPVRLDLFWPSERCIVEIDGAEHCEPVKFDADRRRDVQLQLDGYAVLRFTNARVLHDVEAVVTQISQFIEARRRDSGKGTA